MAFDYQGNARSKKRRCIDFAVGPKPKRMDARTYRALIGPKLKKVLESDCRKLSEMCTTFSNPLGLLVGGLETSNATVHAAIPQKEDKTNDINASSKLIEKNYNADQPEVLLLQNQEGVHGNGHVGCITGEEFLGEPFSFMKRKRNHEEGPVLAEQQQFEFSCPNQQFIENTCPCHQSLCQLSIRTDSHGGVSMAMSILQEKKFESVPSEEEELEEGEIRELEGETTKTQADTMRQLGVEQTELEEGEIRESPCRNKYSHLQISREQVEASDLEQSIVDPKQPEGDTVHSTAILESPPRNSCSLQVSMEQVKTSDLDQASVDPKQTEGDIVQSTDVRESPSRNSCSLQQTLMVQIYNPDLEQADVETNQLMSDTVQSAELAAGKFLENVDTSASLIRLVDEIHCRREEEICKRQQKEIEEFDTFRFELEDNLRKKHGSESSILKELDADIQKCRRKLKCKHWLAKLKEKSIKARWLEEAKMAMLPESFGELPLTETGFSFKSVMVDYDQDGLSNDSQEAVQLSKPASEPKNVDTVSLEIAESADLTGRQSACAVEQRIENDVTDSLSLGKGDGTDTEQCDQELNQEGVVLASSQLNDVELPSSVLLAKDAECGNESLSEEGRRVEHSQPPMFDAELDHMEISTLQVEPASQAQQISGNVVISVAIAALQTENESEPMVNELLQAIEMPHSSHQTEEMIQPSIGNASQIEPVSLSHQISGNVVGSVPVGALQIESESAAMQNELLEDFEGPNSSHQTEELIQLPTGALSSQIDRLARPERSDVRSAGTSAGPVTVGAPPEFSGQPQQMYPMTSFRPSLVFHSDIFLNEEGKILSHKESDTSMHVKKMEMFRCEREKEIEEVNRKYSNLIETEETRYRERQNNYDMIYEKICLNRALAEAYKKATADCWTRKKGMITTSAQHHPPQPSAPLNGNTERPVQAPMLPIQSPQVVHHPSELFSRDPAAHSNSLTAVPAPNYQAGTQWRSPAPHLRISVSPSVVARQNQMLTSFFSNHPVSNVAISQPQLRQVAPARFGHCSMSGSINETTRMERPGALRPLSHCSLSTTQLNLQQNASAVNSPLAAGFDPRMLTNRQGIYSVRPANVGTTSPGMANEVVEIPDD